MIALADWIEPIGNAPARETAASSASGVLHSVPERESLIVFAAIVLIGLACHVAACWRKA